MSAVTGRAPAAYDLHMRLLQRSVLFLVVAGLVGALAGAASASSDSSAPIVTVTRHGGLCVSGSECRTTFRVGDEVVTGKGYRARVLKPGERAALLRAIAKLDAAYLKAHPFKGTCPIAYDGQESTYRFRGFPRSVASCTYDLRAVAAVKVVERLLSSLKPTG